MKHLGWILDLYHKPGQMVIWLKKPDGDSVRLVDYWRPKIHVCGDYKDLVELACKSHTNGSRFINKFERAGDLEKSRVLEIDVESDNEAAELARQIQRDGKYSKYRLYDVDTPAPQAYLYQKDLFPLALVEAEENRGHVQWLLRDSRDTIDFKLPPLRKIRLQLQTLKKRRVQTFQDELSSIQIAPENEEIVSIDSGSESEKILELVDTFRRIDPDFVLTAGGDSFLFPYLARRALENGILDKLILGREQSPLRVYEVQGHSYFSYGKILYRETAARLLGRLHIDDHNAFISVDCGLEGLFEISRTCIIPLQKASRATIGTNMSSLQLFHATKQEVLIPWNKNQPEEWKDGSELVIADRGGFIYEPKTGIHDQVGELDFTSLYPMLMWKKNLSGETVKCKCCPDSTNRVPELDYHICRRPGIVPLSLEILLDRRAKYKEQKKKSLDEFTRQKFDERQSALKWILVCSFGYLGFKNARFGKIDAHIATCAFSRVVIKQAIAMAEEQGFRLVHGIVDSMWLSKPGATVDDYEKLSARISGEINLPLGFEGQYKWIVFLNSKINPHIPVLNRYYGVFQDGTIKIRGIDLRRHDTPEIVRKCQSSMLEVFTEAENSEQFIQLIPKALRVLKGYVSKIRGGRVRAEELVITKNLSKNPDEYTHHVPQAVAAKRLVKEGGTVHAGQQVDYILAKDRLNISENRAIPWELVDENTVYDSDEYVKLLLSSAANLLLPFGYDTKTLQKML